MRRWVPALALVAVLTGCASAGPSPSAGTPPAEPADPSASASDTEEPVPRFIGAADDGATFAMTVGQTTTLRATDAEASDPDVDGAAVLVIPVVNVAASAGREWEVRAVEPGSATIRGDDGGTAWTITFAVAE